MRCIGGRVRGSMRQRETEDVAPCRHGNILHTIDGIGHRRGMHRLACIEVPESTSRARVNRFERFAIIAEEQQSASRRQRPAPGPSGSYLRVAPNCFPIGQRQCQQDLLGLFRRGMIGSGIVERLACHEFSGLREKNIAVLQGEYIEESGIRIVGRRKPICRSVNSWADVGALRQLELSR